MHGTRLQENAWRISWRQGQQAQHMPKAASASMVIQQRQQKCVHPCLLNLQMAHARASIDAKHNYQLSLGTYRVSAAVGQTRLARGSLPYMPAKNLRVENMS